MSIRKLYISIVIISGLLLLLVSCNLPSNQATPTSDAKAVFTEAAITVAAHLTQSAALTPSPTSTQIHTATLQATLASDISATTQPVITNTPTTNSETSSTADSASFVTDVTIPDGTGAAPGVVFEKVWRIKNTGTTTWSSAYTLVWVEGDKMGSPDSVPFPNEVRPNETVDIAIKLTAPSKPGTYQTYFRLRNANGQFFKLDSSGDLWVKIIVGLTATNTPGTETPEITPTQ